MAAREDLEIRDVVSDDPSLTPEANRLLTCQARRAVGRDKVSVPRATPRRSREARGGHSRIATELAAHRILIAISLFTLVVTAAIVSLATGSWWAVVCASVLHAVGAFIVLRVLAMAAGQTEHVDQRRGASCGRRPTGSRRAAQRPRRGVRRHPRRAWHR